MTVTEPGGAEIAQQPAWASARAARTSRLTLVWSAQSTDQWAYAVPTALLVAYPGSAELAGADPETPEQLVYPTSCPRYGQDGTGPGKTRRLLSGLRR